MSRKPVCSRTMLVLIVAATVLFCLAVPALQSWAEAAAAPDIRISFGHVDEPGKLGVTLQILLLLTVLSLAPAIVILLTSFTRIVVVLSFLRQAMGTHQMPPNQVIIGLALFLTFFIMSPVIREVNDKALQPYLAERIGYKEAISLASEPLRRFMFRQTREKDLALFIGISSGKRLASRKDVPFAALIPAFVISELKTAFQIGFTIYIPFLILDMVVASVLLSMGMMMLPPIMISLPFKLMLFVLVDGWYLLVGSLVKSFG